MEDEMNYEMTPELEFAGNFLDIKEKLEELISELKRDKSNKIEVANQMENVLNFYL